VPPSADSPKTPSLSGLATFRESISLLATRRFGTFWFASLLSSIGTWAQQVAQPWLLLTLGASSFLIGLDSFAMNAPVWLLTLAGGALADRSDRRRVIAGFQSIQMLCPAAIVGLMVAGVLEPWMIIALSAVVGATDALSMPSFQSIVPTIVPRAQIGRGLALNSAQFNLSRILGPSIAGVLMSGAGATACFVVSTASYVPFIGVALWILPRWAPVPPSPEALSPPHPFAGIGSILRRDYQRGALLTVLTTSVFCVPLVTFSPVLVKEIFHGDAGRFSTALASFGAGGLLGALGLLGVAPGVERRSLCAGFALLYGAALVLTALDPWFWGIPPLLVLAGAAMTVSNTAANSLLQAAASPHLLGQTVSLYMLAMRGGISLGSLLTGAAISLLGVRHALLLDGLLALVIQAAVTWRWRQAPRDDAGHAPRATDAGHAPRATDAGPAPRATDAGHAPRATDAELRPGCPAVNGEALRKAGKGAFAPCHRAMRGRRIRARKSATSPPHTTWARRAPRDMDLSCPPSGDPSCSCPSRVPPSRLLMAPLQGAKASSKDSF
jgi:predicted MFS family arabinose efflux permease